MARPKGVREAKPRHTAAKKQAEAAAAEGIMPLDVMLVAMREEWAQAETAETPAQRSLHMLQACGIAERAAPYCHSRLAAVQHAGPNGGEIPHGITIRFVRPGSGT